MNSSINKVHILSRHRNYFLSFTPSLVFIDRYPSASGEIILTIFTLQFFIMQDSRNLSSISAFLRLGVAGIVLAK